MLDSQAPVAVLEGVTIRYGTVAALCDVRLRVPAGATGLLGPNGAGKSTLLRALLGLVRPSSGTMRVFGLDVARAPLDIRARVGYMPERDGRVEGMTAVQFVSLCGELGGLPRAGALQRAHEVLYHVGLGEARYRALDTYSPGMRQRARLAQALVHDPDLLLLDEPTAGLDPRGRDEMLGLIRDLGRSGGISLVLSSHLLPDIEQTCDHVVMLDRGRVVAEGAIEALTGQVGSLFDLRVKSGTARMAAALRHAGIACDARDDGTLRVTLRAVDETRRLFVVAGEAGLQVRHLQAVVPTLEDAFARIVASSR